MSKSKTVETPQKTNKKQTKSLKSATMKMLKPLMRWAAFTILVAFAYEGVKALVNTNANLKQVFGVGVVALLTYIFLAD